MVKNGEKEYDFIEVMACPGGCVNGGGQPIVPASVRNFTDVRHSRCGPVSGWISARVRKSHENPDIEQIYAEYFGRAAFPQSARGSYTWPIPLAEVLIWHLPDSLHPKLPRLCSFRPI